MTSVNGATATSVTALEVLLAVPGVALAAPTRTSLGAVPADAPSHSARGLDVLGMNNRPIPSNGRPTLLLHCFSRLTAATLVAAVGVVVAVLAGTPADVAVVTLPATVASAVAKGAVCPGLANLSQAPLRSEAVAR